MAQNKFKNPFVSSLPVLNAGAKGNGTLTVDRLTHFSVSQEYTAICTAVAPFTVFTILSSLDGPVGVATVGQPYSDQDKKIFLTINQGPTLFDVGDTFTFEVTNGTDFTQENMDSYDEIPQKNFSGGTKGVNSGDDNLRFSSAAKTAARAIEDLTFTSKLPNEQGNAIEVNYLHTPASVKALRVIQDLKFEAVTSGSSGNGISIEFLQSLVSLAALGALGDVGFIANTPGLAGNNITVNFTAGASGGAANVSVAGNAITVQIQSGVTTANTIKTAINAHAPAYALITAYSKLLGTEPQATAGPVNLTGGQDNAGFAGSEVVSVVGQAIQIRLQSGFSTAAQIKAAVEASGPAAALVSVTLLGTGLEFQAAPEAAVTLVGGGDSVGGPGNELVSVSGTKLTVMFQSGVNTAAEILAALEASSQAMELVDVAITGTALNPQTAPQSQFLRGGAGPDTFAPNVNELSDPAMFHEGSGSILVKDLAVQGKANVVGDTKLRGLLSLDDVNSEANSSGAPVPNAQGAINRLMDAPNIFLTGGRLLWSAPNLSFSEDLKFHFKNLGTTNRVFSSSSPIVLQDGESAYVVVNRYSNANLTPIVATQVPGGMDVFRLVSRIGSFVVLWDNTTLAENQLARVGQGVDLSTQVMSLLEGGGTISHALSPIGQISWDAPLKVRPLGSSAEITIPAATLDLADDEVAFISIDETITTATKTIQKALRSQVTLGRQDTFWIFHRTGSKVIVRNGSSLVPGEERTIGEPISADVYAYMGSSGETDADPDYTNANGAPSTNIFVTDGDSLTKGIKKLDTAIVTVNAELMKLASQLRLVAQTPATAKIAITAADQILSDGTTLSQLSGGSVLNFGGAVVDFTLGKVFKADGVTNLGADFTPPAIANGRYLWLAISVVANSNADSDGRYSATVLVTPATADGSSPALAPRALFPTTVQNLIPRGLVLVTQVGGALQPIGQNSIIQLGFGSGSGSGSGSGGGGSVTFDILAGENLAKAEPFYISSGGGIEGGRISGRAYKLDANYAHRMEFAGFASAAILAGATGKGQLGGELDGFSSLTTGQPVYASAGAPGGVQQTPPSIVGQFIIQLGIASAANRILINSAGSATAIQVTSTGVAGAANSGVILAYSSTQRDALIGTDGMTIFNTTAKRLESYFSGSWYAAPVVTANVLDAFEVGVKAKTALSPTLMSSRAAAISDNFSKTYNLNCLLTRNYNPAVESKIYLDLNGSILDTMDSSTFTSNTWTKTGSAASIAAVTSAGTEFYGSSANSSIKASFTAAATEGGMFGTFAAFSLFNRKLRFRARWDGDISKISIKLGDTAGNLTTWNLTAQADGDPLTNSQPTLWRIFELDPTSTPASVAGTGFAIGAVTRIHITITPSAPITGGLSVDLITIVDAQDLPVGITLGTFYYNSPFTMEYFTILSGRGGRYSITPITGTYNSGLANNITARNWTTITRGGFLSNNTAIPSATTPHKQLYALKKVFSDTAKSGDLNWSMHFATSTNYKVTQLVSATQTKLSCNSDVSAELKSGLSIWFYRMVWNGLTYDFPHPGIRVTLTANATWAAGELTIIHQAVSGINNTDWYIVGENAQFCQWVGNDGQSESLQIAAPSELVGVAPGAVILKDDFKWPLGVVPDGWLQGGAGKPSVSNGALVFDFNGLVGANTLSLRRLTSEDWSYSRLPIEISFSYLSTQPVADQNLYFGMIMSGPCDPTAMGVVFGLTVATSDLKIKGSVYKDGVLLGQYTYPIGTTFNSWYKVKVQFYRNLARFNIWSASLSEPIGWALEVPTGDGAFQPLNFYISSSLSNGANQQQYITDFVLKNANPSFYLKGVVPSVQGNAMSAGVFINPVNNTRPATVEVREINAVII